jgi:hypothetical protein
VRSTYSRIPWSQCPEALYRAVPKEGSKRESSSSIRPTHGEGQSLPKEGVEGSVTAPGGR